MEYKPGINCKNCDGRVEEKTTTGKKNERRWCNACHLERNRKDQARRDQAKKQRLAGEQMAVAAGAGGAQPPALLNAPTAQLQEMLASLLAAQAAQAVAQPVPAQLVPAATAQQSTQPLALLPPLLLDDPRESIGTEVGTEVEMDFGGDLGSPIEQAKDGPRRASGRTHKKTQCFDVCAAAEEPQLSRGPHGRSVHGRSMDRANEALLSDPSFWDVDTDDEDDEEDLPPCIRAGKARRREIIRSFNDGACECDNKLDSGQKCKGCDLGTEAYPVPSCRTVARALDHTVGNQRSDATGPWGPCACKPGTGCKELSRIIKEKGLVYGGEPAYKAPPSYLCNYSAATVPTEVLRTHFRCRCQAICDNCHQEYTSDRAGGRGYEAQKQHQKEKRKELAKAREALMAERAEFLAAARAKGRAATGSKLSADAPALSRVEAGKLGGGVRGPRLQKPIARSDYDAAMTYYEDYMVSRTILPVPITEPALSAALPKVSAPKLRIIARAHEIRYTPVRATGYVNSATQIDEIVSQLRLLPATAWEAPANVK